MSNVQDTSLSNYIQLADDGTLERRELEIYEHLEQNPNMTDWELTYALGYKDRNEISPARYRLTKKGIIEANGKRKDLHTNRVAYQWKVK